MKKFKFFIFGAIFLALTAFSFVPNYFFNSSLTAYCSTFNLDNIVKSDISLYYNSNLPESYDLRTEIDIVVENQKNYGICYSFATLTMLETYLAKTYNEYYDFSDIHLAVAKYTEFGLSSTDSYGTDYNVSFNEGGGNFYNFYEYCNKNLGPVLEEEMPMSVFQSYSNIDQLEDLAETYYNKYKQDFSKIVKVNQFVSFYNSSTLNNQDKIANRNSIKQHVMTYGSCVAGVYASTKGSHNGTQYLNSVNYPANHMINIIGWDDTYQPSSWSTPGAYLCLNSWGDNGYGGVLYVSYNDVNIETEVFGITDAEINSNNNFISNTTNVVGGHVSYTLKNLDSCITTVTDVSNKLNEYIHEINVSLYCNDITNVYLGFIEDKNILKFISESDVYFINSNVINSVATNQNKLDYYIYPLASCQTIVGDTSTTSYSIGNKYTKIKLNTPIQITNKYAILILECNGIYSLSGLEVNYTNDACLHTYWGASPFTILKKSNDLSIVMPTTFETSKSNNNLTNQLGKIINSTTIVNENNFVCNNATFITNTLSLNLENLTTELSLEDVKIYSANSTTTTLTKTDVTSSFNITIDNKMLKIKQIQELTLGNYIMCITQDDNKFYRSFQVIDVPENAIKRTVTYNLNGGVNNTNNSEIFLDGITNVKFYYPTKVGYDFEGWYIDENFNTALQGETGTSSLGNFIIYSESITSNLTLYAKWKLQDITITNQPKSATKTYDGSYVYLTCNATHPLKSETNQLSYQWYKIIGTDETLLENQNTATLKLINVSDSGQYKCKINFLDTTVWSNTCNITINKANYNLSWNYTSPFVFNNQDRSVDLVNSYDISYTITNSTNKFANTYVSSVNFISWNENYNMPVLSNLTWQIVPANITVTINDVQLKSFEELETYNNFTYSVAGTIYSDYQLNLSFNVSATENEYVKLISATFAPTSNYNIQINNAYIKVTKSTLSTNVKDATITVNNEQGYIHNATLSVNELNQQNLSTSNQKYIDDKNLTVLNIYDISINDFTLNSENTITIDLNKNLKDKKIQVYYISNNGLTLLDCTVNNNAVTFSSTEFGKFIIVEAPQENELRSVLISLAIILICALVCCVVITRIKSHRSKKY